MHSYNHVSIDPAALLLLQIIPTVGIGKDDDDGKAAASQLKHFRNLVNETASKARFLSSFKGGPSKQGSGLSGKGSEELSALPSPSPGVQLCHQALDVQVADWVRLQTPGSSSSRNGAHEGGASPAPMSEACAAVTEPAKPAQHSREASPRSFFFGLFLKGSVEWVPRLAFQVLCHLCLRCQLAGYACESWQGRHGLECRVHAPGVGGMPFPPLPLL